MLVLTMGLLIGQGTAALFYPFYLWITLGMGFRYGRSYLLVSAVSSLLSFALVIAMTDYWRTQPALAAGLWVALLVLPAYALSLLTKLTDALARAEEANRAKNRFLATMSHELRTPLHAIIGMADLLRASPLRAEQQDMIRTVRSAGQTLLEMIGDLLDVAKIESGTMTVQPAPFDLHALLATVRALLHHQARDKGLRTAPDRRSIRALSPRWRGALAAADPGQSGHQRDQVHRRRQCHDQGARRSRSSPTR